MVCVDIVLQQCSVEFNSGLNKSWQSNKLSISAKQFKNLVLKNGIHAKGKFHYMC